MDLSILMRTKANCDAEKALNTDLSISQPWTDIENGGVLCRVPSQNAIARSSAI